MGYLVKNMRSGFKMEEGRLAFDEAGVFDSFAQRADLRSKVVLEVGGCLPESVVLRSGVSQWWSVDPRNPLIGSQDLVRTIRGVASRIPLPDKSVDFVFSCNAFQHIQDLPATFVELRRLLRSGGICYANFGPIWSAPDGSHIEGLVHGGIRIDFWEHAIIPSWSHLVFDETELATILAVVYSNDWAEAIAAYVHRSDWINRHTLTDYRRLLEESGFRVLLLGGCCDFGYAYRSPQIGHPLSERLIPDRIFASLWQRYGMTQDELAVRDLELVLQKT